LSAYYLKRSTVRPKQTAANDFTRAGSVKKKMPAAKESTFGSIGSGCRPQQE
jgi:hypothetical protein